MRYLRILTEIAGMPLAIEPTKLKAVMQFLADQANGTKYSAVEIEARTGGMAKTDRQVRSAPGAVAVLPVRGVIAQRMNVMDEVSGGGGTSTEVLKRQFQTADADPNVKAIILDISSPGGSVYGVAELGAVVAATAARGDKPVIAVVNSLAASAAYWLASQANEIVITPGGEAGSIGVYTVHQDVSAAAEKAGVMTTYVSAGKFKVEGNPFAPLDDDARAAMQARVDDYYGMFVDAVAAGRGAALGRKISRADVMNGFGQGRVLGAKDAIKEDMADRIGTLDDTLARFGTSAGEGGKRTAAEAGAPAPSAHEGAAGPTVEQPQQEQSAGRVGAMRRALELAANS